MKTYQKTIELKTKKLHDFVNITKDVAEVVNETGISNGMVFVNAPHTTVGLILQENDETIFHDMKKMFERILPPDSNYKHSSEGKDNAIAHITSNLLGTSLAMPVTKRQIELGNWQNIFLVELFEGRVRKVVVTVIGE
ncbi:MAG: YjbQ family protein [Candidatus Aenigmarchaeota archaeon]|nr:YjbQ family protein [Candidatus Aenigmarchaeota archaeon]